MEAVAKLDRSCRVEDQCSEEVFGTRVRHMLLLSCAAQWAPEAASLAVEPCDGGPTPSSSFACVAVDGTHGMHVMG